MDVKLNPVLQVGRERGRAYYWETFTCTVKAPQRRVHPLSNRSLSLSCLVLNGKEKEEPSSF